MSGFSRFPSLHVTSQVLSKFVTRRSTGKGDLSTGHKRRGLLIQTIMCALSRVASLSGLEAQVLNIPRVSTPVPTGRCTDLSESELSPDDRRSV